MTIPFGRRRLVVSLVAPPTASPALDVPDALGATDAELAHLNREYHAAAERGRWEAMTLMYGGQRRT